MTIPASRFVKINPGVVDAGGAGLVLNGLQLTQSLSMPTNQVLSFPSTAAVSAFFGPSAPEVSRAQTYFNAYIRARDKHKTCVSCDKPLGSKFDAGHYYSAGGFGSVRFNELNVHGQCVYCNQHLHANLLNYQIGIEQRIGGEALIELHEQAHQVKKYTREELRDIIEIYKRKIKEIN